MCYRLFGKRFALLSIIVLFNMFMVGLSNVLLLFWSCAVPLLWIMSFSPQQIRQWGWVGNFKAAFFSGLIALLILTLGSLAMGGLPLNTIPSKGFLDQFIPNGSGVGHVQAILLVALFSAFVIAMLGLTLAWSIHLFSWPGLGDNLFRLVVFYSLVCLLSSAILFMLLPVVFRFYPNPDYGQLGKLLLGSLFLPGIYLIALFFLERNWLRGDKRIWIKHALILISAALTALAFPQADFFMLRGIEILAWFSLIPYFYLLLNCNSWRQLVRLIFAWEFFHAVFLLYWIRDFAELGMPFVAVCLPFFRLLPLLIAYFLVHDRRPFFRAVLFVSGFLLADSLKTFGYLAFPWGSIGYSQVDWTALAMFSRWGGVFLVSLLVLTHNMLLALFLDAFLKNRFEELQTQHQISKPILSGLATLDSKAKTVFLSYGLFVVFIAFHLIYFQSQLPKPDPLLTNIAAPENKRNFIIVQPVFDPWAAWDENQYRYLHILRTLTDQGVDKETDFILWTESSTLERFALYEQRDQSNPFQEQVKKLIKKHKKPLLTGAVDSDIVITDDGIEILDYNSATLFDPQARIVGTYRKNQLVPFGEWFPYDKLLPGFRSILDLYGASSWAPGKDIKVFRLDSMGSFGTLICYEGIFFRQVRDYVNRGANYFINITNLMWTSTYAGHIQHAAMAQMRAIEQNSFFIRAANDGLSCTIDPYGRVIQKIPLYERGVMKGSVDISPREKTFYAKYGDWLLIILLGNYLMAAVYFVFNHTRPKAV